MRNRQTMLSMLWVFATLNYIYADVFTLFFDRETVRELETGQVAGMEITQGFVLFWAVIMETAIAMVLLSRVLRYSANRWLNIGIGALHTAAVAWSLTEGAMLYYWFFAAVEITCTLFIIWYAWTWRPLPQDAPAATSTAGRGQASA